MIRRKENYRKRTFQKISRSNESGPTMDKEQVTKLVVAGILSILFMLISTVGGIVVFNKQVKKSMSYKHTNTYRTYEKYYVMIPTDRKSSLWQSVYQAASYSGKK